MIKKEFLNLNQSLSCDKNGYQGIWKFWVNGKGGPKDLKSCPMVPPMVSIFFKSVCNYPETFSNDQKAVSKLKPITFWCDKNRYQGIWKFWVNGRGGQRIWNQALWSPLWYRFFSKVFVTIPRRFQMIKKEFLNLNQSLSSDKNGYQGIWKFWVNGNGGQRIWNQALWSPLWYRFFFKSCCNYPETF